MGDGKGGVVVDRTMVVCVIGIMLVLVAQWGADLLQPAPSPGDELAPFVGGHAAAVVACALCAIAPSRARSLAAHASLVVLLAVLMAASRLGMSFGGLVGGGAALALLCSAASSMAEAFVLLLWFDRCARLEMRRVAVVVPLAYLLAGLAYFCLAAVTPAVGAFVLSMCPAASALILLEAQRSDDRPRKMAAANDEELLGGQDARADEGRTDAVQDEVSPQASWSFPVYPVVLMVSFKLVFYFSLRFTSGPSSFGPLGIVLVCTFALVGALFWFDTFRAGVLYRIALPLMVLGLLMEGWLDVGTPAATLATNAANIAFSVFILVSLCEVCFRYHVDALWLIGIVEAFSQLASAIGFGVGAAFTACFPAGSPMADAVLAALVVILVTASSLVFDERMVTGSFGIEPHTVKGSTDKGEVPTVMTYYEDLVWRCNVVARRFGLSHREEEILQLIAQGMSSARIEDELTISKNTVKTHTHHVYEKLGVHSRDEARKMVEQVRSSDLR